MARGAARDAAFRMLFADSFGGVRKENILEMIELTPTADDWAYIEDVTGGAERMREDIDEAIGRHARDWDIDRLARADAAILRLAAYEILRRGDIPASVTVSEAVALAGVYSSDEAPGFVNGVLGALVREVGKA